MRYVIWLLFSWVPLRIYDVRKSEDIILIYMKDHGIMRLNADLVTALSNEALRRTNERAVFRFVSYGLFTFVLTEILEKSANIILGRPQKDDERLNQIIGFYLKDEKSN